MTISLTDLYEILSAKLGKEEAKALTTYVEEKVEQQVEQKLGNVITTGEFHKGLNNLERHINTKLWTAFVTLVVMILGLYAAILLKN